MTPTLLVATYAGNHTLRLRFGDGVEGEIDLADKLSADGFLSLRDVTFFRQFRLDRTLHTLVWPNGAQFAPEFLYQQVRQQYQRTMGSLSVPYAAMRSPTVDDGHLKTIETCHYVWGGLSILFSSLFIFHIVVGLMMINGSLPFPTNPGGPPPKTFGYLFAIMGSVAVCFGWSLGILTILSGRAIARRRWRVFSLVMAGVNCISFPFGTLLGVFTFIVLLRTSVVERYA